MVSSGAISRAGSPIGETPASNSSNVLRIEVRAAAHGAMTGAPWQPGGRAIGHEGVDGDRRADRTTC
jgi:hypothetical protein